MAKKKNSHTIARGRRMKIKQNNMKTLTTNIAAYEDSGIFFPETISHSNQKKRKDLEKEFTPVSTATQENKIQVMSKKRKLNFDEQARYKYLTDIMESASEICHICGRLGYRKSVKQLKITNKIKNKLEPFNVDLQKQVQVCHCCKETLGKNKIPAYSKFNKMEPGQTPNVLKELNDLETRLILRIKPFMKVYKFRGYGQYALKGTCVHFAQCVQELNEQLPLNIQDSQMVIVAESFEGLSKTNHFGVRPKKIRLALEWLKANNHLYRHVDVVDRNENDFDIEHVIIRQNKKECNEQTVQSQQTLMPSDTDYYQPPQQRSVGFVENNRFSILHGHLNQGLDTFGINKNCQCTAMSAMAIAIADIFDPNHWTKDTMNHILYNGHRFYMQRLVHYGYPPRQYLMATEILGNIDPNREQRTINLSEQTENIIVSQISNRFNIRNVKYAVRSMLRNNDDKVYAIFTGALHSYAIIKCNNNVYFFDSHACTPTGRHNEIRHGKACIIQIPCNRCNEITEDRAHFSIGSHICKQHEQDNGSFNLTRIYCTQNNQDNGEVIDDLSTSLHNLSIENFHSQNIQQGRYQTEDYPRENDTVGESEDVTEHNNSIQINIQTMMVKSENDQPNLKDCISEIKQQRYNLRRETAAPVYHILNTRLEELSFIKLFPYGINGFREEREYPYHKITGSAYAKARVMGSDPRFQSTEYLFYVLAMIEDQRLNATIQVCANMRNNNRRVDNLFAYTKGLRGTSSYWNSSRSDLIALINSIPQKPTWFLTLSAREIKWDDMIVAMLKVKYANDKSINVDLIDLKSIDHIARNQLLIDYPVVAARHFNHRFKCLLEYLKTSNDNTLGGKLKDYWYRVEFQARGSPHIHMLLWIENAPSFDTAEGIDLINNVMTCAIPEDDDELKHLVENVQIHKCTFTCLKMNHKSKNTTGCRFGFPKKSTEKTVILNEEEILKTRGRFVELKRNNNESRVNPYNPLLLTLWQANMDIQPVGSMFGVVYYIAKYIAKEETIMMRPEVQNAITAIKQADDSRFVSKIKEATHKIFAYRERSAQEAAYLVVGLRLKGSTHSTVFVNTKHRLHRTRMLRRECITNEEAEYNDSDYLSDIHDKYSIRPEALEELCLAEFAQHWKVKPKTNDDKLADKEDNQTTSDSDVEVTESVNKKTKAHQTYNLMNSRIEIQKRKNFACLKTSFIHHIEEEEEYYYSLVLLYFPFRVEAELLTGYQTAKECFRDKFNQLRPNVRQAYGELINKHEEINRALERIDILNNAEHGTANTADDGYNDDSALSEETHESEETDQFPELVEIDEGALKVRIGLLNKKQREAYEVIREHTSSKSKEHIYLCLHGSGGTGKSFVAKIVMDLINLCYNAQSTDTTAPVVVVAAPTGVAAKNIGGVTLHNAFKLPIEKFHIGEYLKLKGNYLEALRRRWRNARWVIIDEISMISYEVFRQIHLRCQEIKECETLFGGLNLLIMGDLLQIQPVNGHWIYEQPNEFKGEDNLWTIFEMYQLDRNVRQQSDPAYGQLCDRIRIGKQTIEDLETLSSRLLEKLPNKDYFDDAPRLISRTKDVNAYNNLQYKKLQSTSYLFKAIDTYCAGNEMGKNVLKKDLYNKIEKTGGILEELNLAIGARVMLRRNLDVPKGLVSGSMGTVRGFKWKLLSREQEKEGDLPEHVLIEFDDPNIASNYDDVEGACVKIKPLTVEFQGKFGKKISRLMLPLILCWAVTIHKMQGATLDKAVVDLDCFGHALEYVAISRVKKLSGLAITRIKLERFLKNTIVCKKSLKQLNIHY